MSHDLDALLDGMDLAAQVSLLSGSDFWHTTAVVEAGVPLMRVSDGPVGARGSVFDGPPSVNTPCGTALAATWDPALVEEIGRLLGRETRTKGASVLLAPTVNLHRTPIGGRNFECMSEDPYLTARTAVAFVRGVQAEGVASCIKHFVVNDTETERMTIDVHADERTLRELYLVPFEAAVREAGVLAVMTAYNRVNGPWAADSVELLDGILRSEWGFDGLVMSDWFGLHSTAEGVIAGCDLEMPGPTRSRGEQLVAAVERGEVSAAQVRACARRVLQLMERVGALDVDGPGPELTDDDPASRALVRRAGAAGMVLLRNQPVDGGAPVLPLRLDGIRRIAVIGPNAAVGQTMGGGSAHVNPTHVVHPLDALRALPGVEVVHALGADINRRLPELDLRLCSEARIDYFDEPAQLDDPAAVPHLSRELRTTRLMFTTDPAGRPDSNPEYGARLHAVLTPDATGSWRFGIESVGATQLLIDGQVVVDNSAVPFGGSFFGAGRAEQAGDVELEAGRPYELVVEMRHHATGMGLGGLNIGFRRPQASDMIAEAVDLAASSDVTVLVVGANDDWESEGWDRAELSLPGTQDELVARVTEVSPATVVVVNAGSPISMPWLDQVDAVLMAWFPGQELGASIADVLTGAVEPQGRLPVTFPLQLEDTPAFEHHPGRNGVSNYLERRLIGYRWYDTVGRPTLFPFGFGLSYAEVGITAASLADLLRVDVELTGDASRDGVEVVQVYVHRVDRGGLPPDEPDQRLVGFARVEVPRGGTARTTVALDPRTYQTWDVTAHSWVEVPGAYELRVGRSSQDVAVRLVVDR